jgi:hypothetical protein
LPVRVAWTAPEVKGATSYLVVVDRAPQPEGQTVSFFVKGDEACKGLRLQSCLSADYLTTRGIYLTAARQLTLAAVAEQDTVWASARRQHDVFVVPLDRAGRRLGEASASVHLVLPRAADGG